MTLSERHVLQLFKEDGTISGSETNGTKLAISRKGSPAFGSALCFNKKGEKIYIGSGLGYIFVFDMTTKKVRLRFSDKIALVLALSNDHIITMI